jgi:hypothetical protein
MVRWREVQAIGIVVGVIVLSSFCRSALGQDVKLTIYPQKMSTEVGRNSLLPPASSLTEGDAVPLYHKAAQALMADKDWARIDKWLALPPDELPLEEAEGALERHMESLKAIAQAVRCRQCNWPALTSGTNLSTNLAEFRRLGTIVRLWAQFEMAQASPESVLLALRTGFGMARHIAQAPSTVQYLSGMGIAAVMRGEIGRWVQTEDAPNLYAALAALPGPFADVEKSIESERKAMPAELPAGLKETPEQFEKKLKTYYENLRVGAKRWESDLALLQCVEALRSYAASHSGQLPQTLAEITEVSVPSDPMTGVAFHYTRSGATAILESPTPPGNKQSVVRYEITVHN